MEYYISIGDWKKLIQLLIVFLGTTIIAVILFWMTLEFFVNDPKNLHLEFMVPVLLLSGIVIFFLSLRKLFAFEKVTLDNDKIVSPMFGTLNFRDLKQYNIIEFFGSDTIILTMINNKKFSIAPAKGGLSNYTQNQYLEFSKELVRKIEIYNKEKSSPHKIKKEISKIEKVVAIFILLFVIAIDLYVLYTFIIDDAFLHYKLFYFNILLLYSINILFIRGNNNN